ncbi:MAG: hypothetical protein FWF43_08730 [Propionibacteriaceae bacterium]|nr:hypothetical protein [Propionibacteriaceae bacterium]
MIKSRSSALIKWTIRRIVRTLRTYRTAPIHSGNHLIDATPDIQAPIDHTH